MAEAFYSCHVVADEQYCSSFAFADVLHFADGFLLEFGIADSEDFVDD